jgi:hypothetical protein
MRSEKCLSPHARDANASARLAALADELGEVERQLAPLKSLFARAEQLRSEIRSEFKDAPVDRSFEIKGERFVLQVGVLQGAGTAVSYVATGYRGLRLTERPKELRTPAPTRKKTNSR